MPGRRGFTQEERARGSARGGAVTLERYGSEHFKQLGSKGGKMRAARMLGKTPDFIIIDDSLKDSE